jgi:hypothetical protein
MWSRDPEAAGPVGFKVTVGAGSPARARVAPGKRKAAQKKKRKKTGMALVSSPSWENRLIVIPFGSSCVQKIILSKKLPGLLAATSR